ncbi:MAG: cation diffusion facilitator family transporter [FCB group bacterium]|jgi:cation diffusion facilitator family transporter|nr:cation diffusion facilitator family transporter [FCB group bacterium]
MTGQRNAHTDALASRALKTTIIGVVVNAMLAVAKGVAGVLGHSYALLADAVESTLDIVSSAVVWGGLRIAQVPPDEGHPYGHGKAEPLAAIVVSITLLGVAISLAVGSIREILSPENRAPETFTLLVLVAVVIIKETLARFVLGVGTEVESTAVKTDAWHHRSDALTSAAAFVGIGVAVLGGEGFEDADDWAALFACLIIAYNGYRLLRPALAEVMDAAPDTGVERAIRETAERVEGVVTIEQCVVRKMGLEYFVDLHVEVDPNATVYVGHAIAHRVKDTVRAAHPRVRDVMIHIEPAGTADDRSVLML